MKVKNNLTFWNKYYKKNRITKESGFARSITKYFNKKLKLIDIGCGDGRDSFYFSKFLKSIVAADQSSIAIKNNKKINLTNIKFIKKNFAMKNFFLKKKFDLIYARFFLHTLNYVEEKNFFKNIKKISKKKTMIFLEFRTIKDKLIKKGEFLSSYERFHGHYRRFIKLADFEKVITQNKFKIFYKKTSNRFSIYKKDKPHLARYILKLSTDR